MKQNHFPIWNSNGLTMIEVVVAMGMLGALMFVLMSTINLGLRGVGAIESMQNTSSLNYILKKALGQPTTCKANLGGMKLSIDDPAGISLKGLYYPKPGDLEKPDKSKPIIHIKEVEAKKDSDQKLNIKSISVKPVANLSTNTMVADFVVELESGRDLLGPSERVRSFPMYVSVDDDGKILGCSDLVEQGPALDDRVCDVSSEGRMYFNAETGKCESRFEMKWFTGDQTLATCPGEYTRVPEEVMGFRMTVCGIHTPPGFKDKSGALDQFKRTYGNGRKEKFRARVGLAWPNSDGSCSCTFAVDVDTTGMACKIHCEKPNMY